MSRPVSTCKQCGRPLAEHSIREERVPAGFAVRSRVCPVVVLSEHVSVDEALDVVVPETTRIERDPVQDDAT